MVKKTVSQPRAEKSAPVISHERDCDRGFHRIVSTQAGRPVMRSPWVPYGSIAQLGSLRAATEFYDGVLPNGVFTTREVEFTV